MRRQALLTMIVALAAAAAGALSTEAFAGARTARTHDVVLHGNRFHPSRLTISRGDSVTWLWEDGSVKHNVVGTRFGSSPVKAHGSFTVHFTRSGSYSYFCTIHAGMTGTIVVH